MMIPLISLSCLALLGVVSAHTGGASRPKATARVIFWGIVAMSVTALVGHIFGVVMG